MDDEVEQLLARFRAATRTEPDDPTRQAIFRAVRERSAPVRAAHMPWAIAVAIAAALVLVWTLMDGDAATRRDAGRARDQALDHGELRESGGDATSREHVRPPIAVPPPPAKVAPAVELPSAPSPSPRALPRPSAPAPAAPTNDLLTRESALIGTARAAVKSGDVAAARTALERHAREFPQGALAREREVLLDELVTKAPGSGQLEQGNR